MPTPLHLLTDTWPNDGQTYNAIRMDVTDSNGGASNTLLRLRRGGADKFVVDKDGQARGTGLFYSLLKGWAQSRAFTLTSATYDSDAVISSATVSWPDGSSGTFTRTVKNSIFMLVDAYTITHVNAGVTVTQPAVTRDENGNITAQPAITVA